MGTGDPKGRPDEDFVFETGTDSIQRDITGETHVRPEPLPDEEPVRIYVIREGDTLAGIAKRFYGDESQWLRILDANRDRVDDEDRLEPGTELRIPVG